MVNVNVTGGTLDREEINYYVENAQKKFPEKNLTIVIRFL